MLLFFLGWKQKLVLVYAFFIFTYFGPSIQKRRMSLPKKEFRVCLKPSLVKFRLSMKASMNLTGLSLLTYFSRVFGKRAVWSLFRPCMCSLISYRLFLRLVCSVASLVVTSYKFTDCMV